MTTLDRLPHVISRSVFSEILNLTLRHPWLARKSNALVEVISICDTEAEVSLIMDLISRVRFLTPNEQLHSKREIATHITRNLKLSEQDTILIALNERELADSSSAYVQQLKGVMAENGGWKTANFIDKLAAVPECAQDQGTIVIVDDFAGSGGSIRKKVMWLREKLEAANKTCRIFVTVATAMDASRAEIEPCVDGYYSVNWLARGISDNFHGQELEDAVATMKNLESKLRSKAGQKKLADYTFGWRQSESLYYSEGENPPNNNFPLFWWPEMRGGGRRDPLIPRI